MTQENQIIWMKVQRGQGSMREARQDTGVLWIKMGQKKINGFLVKRRGEK